MRAVRIVKIAVSVIRAANVKTARTAKIARPAHAARIVYYVQVVKTAIVVRNARAANPAITAARSRVKKVLKTSGASSYFAASHNIKGEVLCQLSCFHIKKIWLSRLLRS